MRESDFLAGVVRASGPVLTRFLAGFTDRTHTLQAPALPNHVAWTLGHCAYTMGRLVERLGGDPLPDCDFLVGDGTRGTSERFDTLSVRLGSRPRPDAAMYPALNRATRIFEDAVDRLASRAGVMDENALAVEVSWGAQQRTRRDLLVRVSLHNAQHAGQLADLRRALAMPTIAG